MSKKILITAVNGFVGGHLAEELALKNNVVYALDRKPQLIDSLESRVHHYWQVDMMNFNDLMRVEWAQIDVVIHLAGLANVGASFENEHVYMDVNVGIIENLYKVLELEKASPRIIAISTGAVYGKTNGPVTEDSPIAPGSPYGKSKVAAEQVVEKYRANGYRDAINVRPFNHAGPHQAPGFLIPDLGTQLVQGLEPIKAGNLQSSRDYTDVRDVVRAYRLLAEADTLHHAVYNICSGAAIKGEDILEMLRQAAGRPDASVEVSQDRLRSNDEDIIVGSHDRLTQDTGWQPEIPIQQTIQDYIDSIS